VMQVYSSGQLFYIPIISLNDFYYFVISRNENICNLIGAKIGYLDYIKSLEEISFDEINEKQRCLIIQTLFKEI